MDSVVSKLQETGQHVVKKGDALLARTKGAGEAFLGEVKDAGLELVGFVRSEAKGWKRYLTQRTSRVQTEARALFAPRTFERGILTRVDGTLRTLDAKVRARLVALDKPTSKASRRKANGKAPARAASGKAKSSGPKPGASSPSVTASVRH